VGFTRIAWTWYVAIGTVVTFVIGLLVSFAQPLRAATEAGQNQFREGKNGES
jgi:heme/copper-type cytochrome/quinol oxidase subunit 2